ncbi:MAG: hypothetical protein DI620_05020 [Haemophilus parainfluenzae]|nr:MAG: hypothetical protein DI620_05020 [Haemophilus parainfluenzae]
MLYPSIKDSGEIYLAKKQRQKNSLYVIWGGSNDVGLKFPVSLLVAPLPLIFSYFSGLNPRGIITSADLDNDSWGTKESAIIGSLASALSGRGAAYVFIPNLVDFSLAPIWIGFIHHNLQGAPVLSFSQRGRSPFLTSWLKAFYPIVSNMEKPLPEGGEGSGAAYIHRAQNDFYGWLGWLADLVDVINARVNYNIRSFNHHLQEELLHQKGNFVFLREGKPFLTLFIMLHPGI